MIHREALVAKRLNETRNVTKKSDFELLLDDVYKMVIITVHMQNSIECSVSCVGIWKLISQNSSFILKYVGYFVLRFLIECLH